MSKKIVYSLKEFNYLADAQNYLDSISGKQIAANVTPVVLGKNIKYVIFSKEIVTTNSKKNKPRIENTDEQLSKFYNDTK